MRQDDIRGRPPWIADAGVTSLGMVVSRILGMVRDIATAALLGMSGGGVMDAFVVAFRVPNLFRRLFGEGALAASYLPVLAAELERDRAQAWRLASTAMVWLAAVLAGLVLAAELVCGLAWLVWGDLPGVGLAAGLSAVLLPYVLLVSLAAQVAATLHCLSEFALAAAVPAVLNLVWIAAAWVVAPWFAAKESQAYVLAFAVLGAGVLQLAVPWPALQKHGFRFAWDVPASRAALGRVARTMVPMAFGLAITQINTVVDSLIVWAFSAPPGSPPGAWPDHGIAHPVQAGAAAAIYFAERVYEFPLGIVGVAVATAIFPRLSRHAARGERTRLGADLTLGLRLVMLWGVPASVGLALLAEPLARLLFEHGEFTPADTLRAGRVIAMLAAGVWASCAVPVLVRGYYALGDSTTPARLGAAAIGLNALLALGLVWPWAESGVAAATTVAAVAQAIALAALFSRRLAPLAWKALGATAARAGAASAVMGAVGFLMVRAVVPAGGLVGRLVAVFVPLAACLAVYAATYAILGGREVASLWGRHEDGP